MGEKALEAVEAFSQNLFEQQMLKHSVFRDRNIISPHYVPEVLPFREKQIKEIVSIMGLALEGKKPGNLFIYGKVGTGKTCTIKHVSSQLAEYAKKSCAGVESAYVNCRNHNTKYKAIMKCVREFYPNQDFLGYSAAFVYEKIVEYAEKNKKHLVIILDEIDKTKDLDELVYALTRANDELQDGSISLVGVSNNLLFKERLDARTKSSLCEQEIVFPPYNAEELKEILKQRTLLAFKEKTVSEAAINLAAAIAAQESGDARRAVMLLLRAGEIADKEEKNNVSDEEVKKAKNKVEEEVIIGMASTLPEQQQLVLYTIACMGLKQKPVPKITGKEEQLLFSGEVYEEYCRIAKKYKESPVSMRWYREYLNELEIYGLILSTQSGAGIRGQARLLKLGFEAKKIKEAIEKELAA